MEQENMKEEFNSVGIVGSNGSSFGEDKIAEQLAKIAAELEKMNQNLSNSKEPAIVSPIIEPEEKVVSEPAIVTPIEEPVTSEIPEDIIEESKVENEELTPVIETPAEVTEEPVVSEEVKEEPFTPVNIDEIKEETVTPVSEPEIKNDSNIIDIEDLLKDAPTVQEPKVEQTPVVEEPKVEVPVEPALEKTVEFKPDVLVGENNTSVPETVQPTVESTVAPTAEITPVEPVQAPTVETVTAPVSMPESTPVVEQPVSQNTELYSDVSKLYSGMIEVKTGNEPHRVIPVNNNDFAKNDVKVNSLVMNNAA